MPSINRRQLEQIYDAYRDALLNSKYYGCQLEFYRKLNRNVEIAQAVVTPGTVGGWAIWHSMTGQSLWAIIASGLAVVAVLKPIFNWPKEIDRFSRMHAEHSVQYHTLKQLVEDIATAETISPEMEKRFLAAREQHANLSREDDVRPVERLRRKCVRQVRKEIPASKLWLPKEETGNERPDRSPEETRAAGEPSATSSSSPALDPTLRST
jgi:hypothetical protein